MSERLFATQGDVLAFLHGLGLKVGRTKISTDYRAGRLKSTPDKRFREEDVLAYAESLKAPAAEERAGRERKLRAERDRLKTLLAALLRALPDEQAVASALETWLRAHEEEEGSGLCHAVREALARLAERQPPACTPPEAPPSFPPETSPPPEDAPDGSARELPDLVYLVQGSSPAPYTVCFRGAGPGLSAACSCPAGTRAKRFCKHVAALLKGEAGLLTLVEGSDDPALLPARAEGSPLLDMAARHTPRPSSHRRIIPAPIAPGQGLKGLLPHLDGLLEGTLLWSEYASEDDGAERITILVRKRRKDGMPRKHPTELLTLTYAPIKYLPQWQEDGEGHETYDYTPVGRRSLPFLVNSTNYGSLDAAWTAFARQLDDLLPRYADDSPHQG